MSLRLLLPSAIVAVVTAAVPAVRADQVSERIDALIEEGYKANKITPNAPASDETFVRRVYLDIIGRIPSQEEAREFLDSAETGKRAKLIDKLIDSEGFVSNSYNWWADILRVQSNMGGNRNNQAGQAYSAWIKDAIRNNMPYDQFVYKLVTAEGYVWDNGAVGYYLRDAGMPLDNMSNTVQIFLGTRLACAQCHNHPFDVWKQKDYYEMAAFTYNVSTAALASKGLQKDMDTVNEDLAKAAKSRSQLKSRPVAAMKRIVDGILDPLKNGVGVNKDSKGLTLPMDYKYDDDKPGAPVTAHTIFGKPVSSKKEGREEYAKWMTNAENPRFTTVIANRLWKRVIGRGLIEPMDDFKDNTSATNPNLMKYLTQQMTYNHYDIKKMLRSMYNTKTYQRQTTTADVPEDKPYHFPGPVLRRMSAEQIWDSICTLVIPNPDLRMRGAGYKASMETLRKEAELIEKATATDIVNVAKKYAEQDGDLEFKARVAREKLGMAREKNDAKAIQAAQKELNEINKNRDAIADIAREELLKTAAEKSKGQFVSSVRAPGSGMMDDKNKKMEPVMDTATANQWAGFGDEFYRASELPSPAPGGHFLREFGQSNREIIENSSREATVSQALSLMNGPLFEKITMEKTQMMTRFNGASSDEGRGNALYLSLFARKPTDIERTLMAQAVEQKGKTDGWKHVIWALLNTREFVFIQ
jgi:hypothetical protein